MKKEICFAGFSGAELEAFQHALSELGDGWSCIFCSNGEEALGALGARSFDAIVASLRMEGMNGGVLLHLAASRFPRVLRFVVGDLSDQELVINCIGAPHQFISSPWRAEDILAIIQRSLALDAWLSNDRLRAFAPRLGRLPGVPATYFEVLKKVESTNVSIESVAEIIARDPALTARLLQMANSPACGLSQKVTSPIEAVSVLGLDALRSLVLCLQLFNHSPSGGMPCISLDSIWRRSFIVGNLAGKIAFQQTSDARTAGDAFTAGLLHKVGQIILATNLSHEYSAVVAAAREKKHHLHEEELAQLGVTSDQVGGYLLGLWGLPLPLVEAVALHHSPTLAGTQEFSLLTAVHVAAALAEDEHGSDERLPAPKLDVKYLTALNLPVKPAAWRKALTSQEPPTKVREQPRELAAATSTPSQRGPWGSLLVFAMIVAALVFVVIKKPFGVFGAQPVVTNAAPPVALDAKPPAPKGFDGLKVQGIIYRADKSLVVINGKTLETGEKVNGAEIVSIERSKVTLSLDGEQKTFTLK
ncbi:MAG TPA: HDOD domain-containing protein [Verrucomicrobiae bacterium]|jgi:HD-like signal output (HDOD) protein